VAGTQTPHNVVGKPIRPRANEHPRQGCAGDSGRTASSAIHSDAPGQKRAGRRMKAQSRSGTAGG
jgi:hypothetical protein